MLGRHICGCPVEHFCAFNLAGQSREAEVGKKHLAAGIEHHVAGLQIAMHHAVFVRLLQSRRNLLAQDHRFFFRQRAPGKPISKRFPRQVLHDEKIDAIQ